MKITKKIKNRLNYLKRKIINGNISYGELAEIYSYEYKFKKRIIEID